MKILLINGPNLNLLGNRENKIYGNENFINLIDNIRKYAEKNKMFEIVDFQSNSESKLIKCIHNAKNININYIIINPGAFTHTSIAIRDALIAINIPFIEVHISNIFNREKFRHLSYFSDIAKGIICGLGISGYYLAINYIINKII